MKKKLLLCIILLIIFCSIGCNTNTYDDTVRNLEKKYDILGEDPYHIRNPGGFNVFFQRNVARLVQDDGWVFTFVYNRNKLGEDDDIAKYCFYGINIRYRYDESFTQVISHLSNNKVVIEKIVPPILVWGEGSLAQKRDMEQISNMLSNDRSVEDLLAIDPETYTFESFDKTIFFTLLREALTGAPQQEGTELSYWEKPSYAFFCEPDWTDGYKFQIAFLQETGGIDVIYIDVLYQNGTEYNDYFQLSDLVDSGQATPAQNDAFALITQIKQQVEAEDNFIACADLYRDKIIEKIDFSRLWRFMLNLHENNYTLYLESPIVEEVEQSDTN